MELSREELRETRRHLQMIFQDPYSSLNPAYSVSWILEEPLRIFGKYGPEERRRRVRDMLERVELPEECLAAKPAELSGGQRQRVYLAMALAQDTETILMDEPTAFLDIQHQMELMALARRLADAGKAVVMVLHDLCLAMKWADRIALLYGGRLLDCGAPEDLYARGCLEEAFGVSLGRVDAAGGPYYYYQPLTIRGGTEERL